MKSSTKIKKFLTGLCFDVVDSSSENSSYYHIKIGETILKVRVSNHDTKTFKNDHIYLTETIEEGVYSLKLMHQFITVTADEAIEYLKSYFLLYPVLKHMNNSYSAEVKNCKLKLESMNQRTVNAENKVKKIAAFVDAVLNERK